MGSSGLLRPAGPVEVVEEVAGGALDLLVLPLCGPVLARDESHAVDAPEVAVNERVAALGLVLRAVGEREVPSAVLVPRVVLEERLLVGSSRLGLAPVAADDVLARVAQLLRVRHGAPVHPVLGHTRNRSRLRHGPNMAGPPAAGPDCAS